ncbi:MAG: peptidase U32 family protein [Eubacteriales bacterium]|jgi:putative protease
MNRPELLAPAGTPQRLRVALQYGADAVYFGGGAFSLRAGAQAFTPRDIEEGAALAHRLGKKIYCAVNVMPRNGELRELPDFLHMLEQAGVDAVIVSDLGVFSLVRQHSGLPIHVSTQANAVNYEACRMWHQLGASRVVLGRECTLEEIAEIRCNTPPELELEAFVHGAMCISYSGRCLLSSVLTGRDSNRGACAQPCRWKYSLVEETRPGEAMPMEEDAHGTYILNAKDLCMIEYIPQLLQAGVTSLKIEGRMKTEYYVATVVNAYRRAIDGYLADPQGWQCPPQLLEEVGKVSHRRYYTGFYFGDQREKGQVYESSSYIREYEVVAMVDSYDPVTGWAECTQKNRFFAGDEVEVLTWDRGSLPMRVTAMQDGEGQDIDVCPHAEMKLRLKVPFPVEKDMFIRKRRQE